MADGKYDLEVKRHSLAHVMAHAVMELFPNAKLGTGPDTDEGFYYDFDLPRPLTPDDLPEIEKKMREILKEDHEFLKRDVPVDQAKKDLKEVGQNYKVELVDELEGLDEESVSMYESGGFVDLCKGPHVKSTKYLRSMAFELDRLAGAYWRGNEENAMLQRIYALAFENKKDLKKYTNQREEAKKRDHRKLGKELDLFSFHEEAPGSPFWHDRGMKLWNSLLYWWRNEHREAGYKEVKTPIILAKDLWERSGHWDHYRDDMYFTKVDDRDFAIKPMNCPGGMLLYKEDIHSYREFPLKVAELGLVHRHELQGTLHGLLRVRAFHQDDAHIFCTEAQIADEVAGVISLAEKMYGKLGLKYRLELSTRPEEGSIGSDEIWQKAEEGLRNALDKKELSYDLNPGDGAFYGPKIDFHIEDAIGRSWQAGTVQLDFAMPERFDLQYIDEAGDKKRPVMLHRVIFGSVERFVGILIEHYAGAFPVWLAPVQAKVLPISDKHMDYAEGVAEKLQDAGIRVEVDESEESVGKKIRNAELQKIPYMLIVGDKEVEAENVSVRTYEDGDQGAVAIDKLVKKINSKQKGESHVGSGS